VVSPCRIISQINNGDPWFPRVAEGDPRVLPVDGDDVRQKVSDSPLCAGRCRVKLAGSDASDDLLQTAECVAVEFVNAHARDGSACRAM
jgi:hypothetical protein